MSCEERNLQKENRRRERWGRVPFLSVWQPNPWAMAYGRQLFTEWLEWHTPGFKYQSNTTWENCVTPVRLSCAIWKVGPTPRRLIVEIKCQGIFFSWGSNVRSSLWPYTLGVNSLTSNLEWHSSDHPGLSNLSPPYTSSSPGEWFYFQVKSFHRPGTVYMYWVTMGSVLLFSSF